MKQKIVNKDEQVKQQCIKLALFAGLSISEDCSEFKDKDNFNVAITSFTNDWNSLMQVIGEIEVLSYEDSEVESFFEKSTYIYFIIGGIFVTCDIKGVYDEVVKFVEWYNLKLMRVRKK
jgi:hypothetical protein